jgi:hypothetical protein
MAIACIAGTLAAACVRDFDKNDSKEIVVADDSEALVTLAISVPDASASRAMSENMEKEVATIDVLLFDETSDLLVYRAIGKVKAGSGATREFEAKLPVGTFNAVVLANVPSGALDAYAPGTTISVVKSRKEVLDVITMTMNINTKWSESVPFPMWGYEDGLVIAATPSNPAAIVALTRAVARVDVEVVHPLPFTLTSVRLYNRNRVGTIAPTVVHQDFQDGYDPLQWQEYDAVLKLWKAIAPQDHEAAVMEKGPLLYNTDIVADKMERVIYTFEAEAGTEATWEDNTCLVIGGIYGSDLVETFYRVEFVDASGDYLPLLRNHKYAVRITGVLAAGYADEEKAYEHRPANLVVEIEASEEGLNDVTFNDQYYLAVDKSEIVLYKEGYGKTLRVATNFGTWTLERTAGKWFTVSPGTYAGTPQTLTVSTTTSGNPGDSFDIVAGPLRKTIIVRQLDEEESYLLITDAAGNPVSELLFGPGNGTTPPTARTFLVQWLPRAFASVAFTPTAGSEPFVYNTGSGLSDLSAPSSAPNTATPTPADPYHVATITVQPTVITAANLAGKDPLTYARSSRVDFSVGFRMLPLT